MVRRLMRGGHACVVYDRSADAVAALVKEGATGAASLAEFVKKLEKPRALCLMVPAAFVDSSIDELVPLLEKGDTIIDGGNSHYQDDIARAKRLATKGLHYVDMGTSGGVWGLERGYCLMIGGEDEVVKRLDPIFATLAPGRGDIPPHPRPREARRHGRARLPPLRPERRRPLREDGPQRHRVRPDGRLRRGPEHPEERQHRQAAATRWTRRRRRCATPSTTSTTSTSADITELWRRGSVIASWLLDLTAAGLRSRARTSRSSAARSPTPARAAGRWRRPTTRACRPTC